MKNLILIIGMVVMTNAFAADSQKYQPPSAAEIATSRACFSHLENKGCGTPDGDYEQFHSCVSQIQDTLDDNCRKTLINLYGDR